MKHFKILLALIFFPVFVYSQPWSVNSADFEFSMNMTGKVKINDNFINQPNSYLGAFAGSECRGVVEATEIGTGDYYYFLTIYSNTSSGEEISFKFSDENGNITDFGTSVSFISDDIYGNPDNPFVWVYPDNAVSTDFLYFSCENQIGETIIDTGQKTINLETNSTADLSNLITYFAVPAGTSVFAGTEEQQSGISQNDFSGGTVIYTLKNGSEQQNWTVSVNRIANNINDYNKEKCRVYPNPVNNRFNVNIPHTESGTFVIHDISGKVIKQSYFNNEFPVIDFKNTKPGIYFLKINTKNRAYNLKIIKK